MSSGIDNHARQGVVFVCTQMEAGGVQILATAMARHLVSQGEQAKVVFLYRKRAVFDTDPNVEVLFPTKPGMFDYIRIVARLFKFVSQRRPAAIIGMAHYSSPLATLCGRLTGVPRRIATQTSRPDKLNVFARSLDWACGMFGIYTSNIPASKSIQRAYEGFPHAYRSKLKTIYNGVSVQPTSLNKKQARARFGLNQDSFLLVTCGRLAAVKNHELLLRVVERVPNVELAILGEGELRKELETSIEARSLGARVTLLGEVSPDQVSTFLSAGDVFVFPSHSEAFGMAVAEAMMAGLPVIASSYCAISEVVGDAGPLLDPADVDGWVDAVIRYRADPGLRAVASARSIKQGSRFTFEEMMQSYRNEFFAGR